MAEKQMYEPVMAQLQKRFGKRGFVTQLEIAASAGASDAIAEGIPYGQGILFSYRSSNRPDILGWTQKRDWIVAEVKEAALGLDEIYQTKRYKELFCARYAFLISSVPVSEQLKRLCRANPRVLGSFGDYLGCFVLAEFNHVTGDFAIWFPENPFENPALW
jgi:hypothetical protein